MTRATFVSVQVISEFAHVAKRKMHLSWPAIRAEVARLRDAVDAVLTIDLAAHDRALRIAERYRLSFYDSLMLSVALIGGARIFYSEDMQDGLVIDDTLRIVNPFIADLA